MTRRFAGNGMRACIGRSFAWQEALLAVASVGRYDPPAIQQYTG